MRRYNAAGGGTMPMNLEYLQRVLDAATLGVWEIDLDSGELWCSPQCKANFGRTASQPFTYADLFDAIHPDDRPGVRQSIAAARGGDVPYQAEYRVRWPDGTTHWISARGAFDRTPGSSARMAGVTLDVTTHKASAEGHRAATEFSQRLIESSVDCIKMLDIEGRIQWVSPAGLDLLGATAGALVGRPWLGFWAGRARTLVRQAMASAAAGTTGRFEARSRTLNGRLRWWDVRVTPICGADGQVEQFLAISTDITERRAAEDALRAACQDLEARVRRRTAELQVVAERLAIVREEERTRLARELHDELGQTLTALKLDVRIVRRAVEAGGSGTAGVLPRLRDMEALLDETLVAIERIVSELRPVVLDELGFCAAAEWLVQQFETRTGVASSFTCSEDVEMSADAATALFRVLQESLTNVARHAAAERVTVSLGRTPDAVVLDIADDGRGLSRERAGGLSFGLRGMEERLRAVGGELQLSGRSKRGTRVLARIPVEAAR